MRLKKPWPAKELTRVVVVSDLHVGSTIGLWPERYPVKDGGYYEINKFQGWLLDCWGEFLAWMKTLKPKPILVVNGDPIQGANRRDGQLVSNLVEIHADAAMEILGPAVDLAERAYFTQGTEWHEGKAGQFGEQLARELGGMPNPTTGEHAWPELYLDLDRQPRHEAVVHFAHHVATTRVPLYEATAVLRDALILILELHQAFGDEAPNVRGVVRSHRHRFVKIENGLNVVAAATPAWQLKTAFAQKVATSSLSQIGYVWLEYDGESLELRKRIFPLPPPHVERLV